MAGVAARVLVAASLAAAADAHSHFMSYIPNGMQVKRGSAAWYGVGHLDGMGGGPLNPFGMAWQAAGYQWTAALCKADSDGDGQTNGFELGDPDCTWKEGGTPSRTKDISHPGFADSTSDAVRTPPPETIAPSTARATTASTTAAPTTAASTTAASTAAPTTPASTTAPPTTAAPSTAASTTAVPTTAASTAPASTTSASTTPASTTPAATTPASTTSASTTSSPSTTVSTTAASTAAATTAAATTSASTTASSTTEVSTTEASTTAATTSSEAPSTSAPSTTAAANASNIESDEAVLDHLCEFENEPAGVGYFWDPSCSMGGLGCNADGKHVQCRLCGAGAYSEIACPPRSCRFPNEPFVPYFWDPTCEMGKLGCWADGVHAHCRFCGYHPYTSIACPSHVGGRGADLTDQNPSPAVDSRCSFANEPAMPYYWDPACSVGKLGCLADGVHPQCRFCAQRPFEGIPCPKEVAPPAHRCSFPKNEEPTDLYFWDATCDLGMLGCWADGIHAQCRFCGGSTYRNVTCPTVRVTGAESEESGVESQTARQERGRAEAGLAMDVAPGADEDEVDISGVSLWALSPSSVLVALVMSTSYA